MNVLELLHDPDWHIFLFGLAGSASVEAARIVYTYERGRPLPVRYHRVGFWFA